MTKVATTVATTADKTISSLVKGRLIYFLFRSLSCVPFRVLQHFGAWAGVCLYFFNTRSRQTTEANLRHCFPYLTQEKLDALVRDSLKESAKTGLEFAALWLWPLKKVNELTHAVQGKELLEQALKKGKGVILLAPHLGNWELINLFAAQQGSVTSLYSPAKNLALDKIMYTGRTRNGANLVPANARGVRSLLKALKASEMVMVLPDQVPEEGSGLFAPFFNQPALTMTLLPSLAKRTGAVVLSCYAQRRADKKGFDIHIAPALAAISEADELSSVSGLNETVEHCVQECLAQYQWEYKRFRKCLPGAKKIY